MARSIYVMPITGDGTRTNPRRPKYRDSLFPTLSWAMFDYGNEPWCVVGILDVPPATDTALNGNADVFEAPANLDVTMGNTATRNLWRNRLEGVNIPGTWIQTTTTAREVIRFIGACCQFAQRYQGGSCGGQWFTAGVTLDDTFGSLSAAVQQCIIEAATSFGFDTSALTGASTLRQVIKSAADQYLAAGLSLNLNGPL